MNGDTLASAAVITNPGAAWSVAADAMMHFIHSGPANEILVATPAIAQEFVFTNVAAGLHTITGFSTVQDAVELPGSEFANFNAVQSVTTATAGGALINLGNDGTLLLSGVNPASLRPGNFALT
jgi:hypothetical protein